MNKDNLANQIIRYIFPIIQHCLYRGFPTMRQTGWKNMEKSYRKSLTFIRYKLRYNRILEHDFHRRIITHSEIIKSICRFSRVVHVSNNKWTFCERKRHAGSRTVWNCRRVLRQEWVRRPREANAPTEDAGSLNSGAPNWMKRRMDQEYIFSTQNNFFSHLRITMRLYLFQAPPREFHWEKKSLRHSPQCLVVAN